MKTSKNIRVLLNLVALILLCAQTSSNQPCGSTIVHFAKSEKECVPDSKTAKAIVAILLKARVGSTIYNKLRPLAASRKGDTWIVSFQAKPGPPTLEAVLSVSLLARNCQVTEFYLNR